jgi:hypothetical protein
MRSRSDRPQLAFFDHAYAVLDQLTADAIEGSDYLRGLGRFVVATTTGNGETWTGRYLFGRRTYVELFGPTDVQTSDDYSSGIGLSTEHRGDLATLASRVGVDVETGRMTREEGDQQTPWFDHLSSAEPSRELEVWVMEFLGEPSDLERRSAAFEEWAQGRAEADRTTPSLGEVSSVRLDAPISDIEAAEPVLRAAGYDVTRQGETWTATDGQQTILLNGGAAADATGLRRIEFSLDSSPSSVHVEPLGRSTLSVGPGPRATWEFGIPPGD